MPICPTCLLLPLSEECSWPDCHPPPAPPTEAQLPDAPSWAGRALLGGAHSCHHHHQGRTPGAVGGQSTGPSVTTLARARLWHLWEWKKIDRSRPSRVGAGGEGTAWVAAPSCFVPMPSSPPGLGGFPGAEMPRRRGGRSQDAGTGSSLSTPTGPELEEIRHTSFRNFLG